MAGDPGVRIIPRPGGQFTEPPLTKREYAVIEFVKAYIVSNRHKGDEILVSPEIIERSVEMADMLLGSI